MKVLKIAAIVSGVLLVAGVVYLFMRVTDHRAELRQALYMGNVSQVEILLDKHPSLASAKNVDDEKKGWTALHIAAYLGNTRMIEVLVKHHAPLEVKDSRGLTPLLWTTFRGDVRSAGALLAAGADINARGNDGRTSIELAKISQNQELTEFLRSRGARE